MYSYEKGNALLKSRFIATWIKCWATGLATLCSFLLPSSMSQLWVPDPAILTRFLPMNDSSLWTHFFHLALVSPNHFQICSNVTFFTLQSLILHVDSFMHVHVCVWRGVISNVIVHCWINTILFMSVPITKAETTSIFSPQSLQGYTNQWIFSEYMSHLLNI